MSNDQLYSGMWTEYYDKIYPIQEYAPRAKLVLDLLKKFNPKAKKLLELGCGSGNYTVYFAKKFDVKATDLSKDMLARAKKKCKAKFALLPMEKGIPAKIVIDPADEEVFHTAKYRKITEMRFSNSLKEFPAMVFIYGEKVAMYTVSGELVGIIIQNKKFAQAMLMIFNMYWNQAKPVKL